MEQLPQDAVPPPPPQVTPAQGWTLIAVGCSLFMAASAADVLCFPELYNEERLSPLGVVQSLLVAVAQAMWISMDRRRLGLEVGAWRYGTFFLGPLIIWFHLLLHYRLRAFYLIPLSAAIYVATWVLGYLAGLAAWHLMN